MDADEDRLNKFLVGMLYIYLAAFASLYYQIPGLYSQDGILPAWTVTNQEVTSWSDWWSNMNVLRLSGRLGLSVDHGLELCSILGMVLCLLALTLKSYRNRILFGSIWLLYYSLFQVGQVFLTFQWDILLLEAGFLCIIATPTFVFDDSLSKQCEEKKRKSRKVFRDQAAALDKDPFGGTAPISLHLIRWLLFRLMFASGVVKLTSNCPTWWGLTALHWHYESQCIPTPFAWFAHHLPGWWHRWCVVATYFIEIGVPFFFFIPTYRLRRFSFCSQIFLQVLIILTGNYNFFNILTINLCLSLLPNNMKHGHGSHWKKMFLFIFDGFMIIGLLCVTARLFSLYIQEDFTVHSKINFTRKELDAFLSYAVPISIWFGGLYLAWEIAKSLLRIASSGLGTIRKSMNIFNWVLVTFLSVTIFCASLSPYSTLHKPSLDVLPKEVTALYHRLHSYEIVNSYGLFRRMTGVGGRPEVIIEGSNDINGPWLEYEFPYKPGNVSRMPPFVIPHQPRLDWQMWFAALSSYQHQHWIINLAYRLLTNEPVVLELLEKNPFPREPPAYIRATRYIYHFMPLDGEKSDKWWYREKPVGYLPPISLKEEFLKKYLIQQQLIGRKPSPSNARYLRTNLNALRSLLNNSGMDGFRFVASILFVAAILHYLNKLLF